MFRNAIVHVATCAIASLLCAWSTLALQTHTSHTLTYDAGRAESRDLRARYIRKAKRRVVRPLKMTSQQPWLGASVAHSLASKHWPGSPPFMQKRCDCVVLMQWARTLWGRTVHCGLGEQNQASAAQPSHFGRRCFLLYCSSCVRILGERLVDRRDCNCLVRARHSIVLVVFVESGERINLAHDNALKQADATNLNDEHLMIYNIWSIATMGPRPAKGLTQGLDPVKCVVVCRPQFATHCSAMAEWNWIFNTAFWSRLRRFW